MAIFLPLKSLRLFSALSRLTMPRIPHTETFMSFISTPLLFKMAAVFVGTAKKSTSPLIVMARSSSGFFQTLNSTLFATSLSAFVSIMCKIGCETEANGPAITILSNFSAPLRAAEKNRSVKKLYIKLLILCSSLS